MPTITILKREDRNDEPFIILNHQKRSFPRLKPHVVSWEELEALQHSHEGPYVVIEDEATTPPPKESSQTPDEQKQRMQKLFKKSKPVTPSGDPV